jgi:outer membrane lipoprotein-sorting protein
MGADRIVQKFLTIALALIASVCAAQSLTPDEALERFLMQSGETQSCSASFTVQIDASLSKLGKRASMTGFEVISPTGQVAYNDLRFTGDHLVKTSVITRFLAETAEPPRLSSNVAITRENYVFTYERTSDYNGAPAYVFRLRPEQKRAGLLRGELWIDGNTSAKLRVWGDLVKSPSIFVRGVRLVQDYQQVNGCASPLRLIVNVDTRLAGEANMVVWLHPTVSDFAEGTVQSESATAEHSPAAQ